MDDMPICLKLIGHSAFVIEIYFYPGLAGLVTNAECSIKSRLLQIPNRPSISFTTVKTACDQCKYSLRDENHDFDDSNQIWPAGARARCGKTFKS